VVLSKDGARRRPFFPNDVVEQDHRYIKHRIRPTLGFKRFVASDNKESNLPRRNQRAET
jgi:transposase-like protein